MRIGYRKFSARACLDIVACATDSQGRIHCERCGRWCPKRADYEIDHVIPEGMRPPADKARKLVAADGQLLCTAQCHPDKTDKDKAEIALAVRREAYAAGVDRPGKKKLRSKPRKERRPYRPIVGKPRIAREYGL